MSRAEDKGKGKGKGVLVNTGSTLIQAANDGEGVLDWSVSVNIVTGSIAWSAKGRYLSN